MSVKLRLKRFNRGVKQGDVARAVGITRAYYSMVENDVRRPSLNLAFKIADYFECDVEEIFVLEELDYEIKYRKEKSKL